MWSIARVRLDMQLQCVRTVAFVGAMRAYMTLLGGSGIVGSGWHDTGVTAVVASVATQHNTMSDIDPDLPSCTKIKRVLNTYDSLQPRWRVLRNDRPTYPHSLNPLCGMQR